MTALTPSSADPSLVAKRVIEDEAAALLEASSRLDASQMAAAVAVVAACEGKVLLTGTGTSGIVAQKIAATLTSTGTPALFLHPADALHGGLGVVQRGDVVVAISNSGETGEILVILPYLRSRGVALVSIVGNLGSTLAEGSDVVLDGTVRGETGPLGLAPTCSSTLALALGDALAMAVLETKGFTPDAFALNHPSGRLGRRLTLKVEDVVIGDLPTPQVQVESTLLSAITAISEGGVGAVAVVEGEALAGLVTDGDIRRALLETSDAAQLLQSTVAQVMTPQPMTAQRGQLAYDVMQTMEDRPSQVSVVPLVDDAGRFVGIVRIHDLVRAGI